MPHITLAYSKPYRSLRHPRRAFCPRAARTLLYAIAATSLFAAGDAPAAPGFGTPLRVDRAALQQAVEKTARELLVPAAVVILRTPAGNFSTALGATEIGGTTLAGPDQHVRVGSNTKTWIGTVILQQVQEGRLKLDDPVSKFRPDVPNGDRITIAELLDMRSGLFNYSETRELNETLDRNPRKVWKPDELLALAFRHPPYFEPGKGYHYSNTNTVLLGLIAEKIDGGKPLARILDERLFKPLGLANTVFPPIASDTLPAPRVRGYTYGTNVETMDTPALPAATQAAARAGTLRPRDCTGMNPSWGWAAGAGISTANDLATWVEALVGGRLLDAATQKLRLASVRPIDPANPNSAQYGLGIAKFGPLYGHTGELPGYNSFMGHDPVNGVTLVVWTNLAPSVDGKDPATTIAKALIGLVYTPTK